ncbi:HAD family hydrolase [Geomicrobium sp. JCM 19039]|uniref:HAD family hydrolase n=1 Tax=Geomicrobium sp. JCM 19039 TaxID=1460636 RepID=UPI00045F20FC|nr:HAD family hydrolase [Geomicrobium sp. JCM 19039]GAK13167.1 phosphoglycolate phosphatase [Geomicrobium sp. JCM 19039]
MKAFIFDFDGTLANTLPLCFDCFRRVFKKFDNRDITNDEIIGMFGPTEVDILRKHLRTEQKEQAVHDFLSCYERDHELYIHPDEEIIRVIRSLKEAGYRLAIVTGKGRKAFDLTFEKVGLETFFDVTITGDEVRQPKPHPEGIERAMQVLGVEATETMYIGDSSADVEAGRRAGTEVAAVQWLPVSQTEQFDEQTVRVWHTLKDLEQFEASRRE